MNIFPRKTAYEFLLKWESDRTFPNLALKNTLRAVKDPRDRRFITAVVYGVIEKKITLDHFIDLCLDNKKIELSVRTLLRMGIYQMFYMSVPDSAACDTTVELSKKVGMLRASRLINAVLRRCSLEKETMLALKKADFSLRYSINVSLVNLLLEQYGKEAFVAMMEGLSRADSSMYLYHNIKRGTFSDFSQRLLKEGIEIEKTDLLNLYKTTTGFSPETSEAYQDGWFHIVSEHSAEAATFAPQNAENLLDLCAAPGGKTFILAANTEETVHSFDIHPHKVMLLQKEAARLGHRNVEVRQQDGCTLMEEWIGRADFVLCDVPCSGLGMMGKKPDIKYKEYDAAYFEKVQTAILNNGAQYLKPGGRLVYSTCTIDRRENEQRVMAFLKDHPAVCKEDSVLDLGEKLYLPSLTGDGFYIAVLKRIN